MHDNVVKFVIWICKRFDRKKVQAISDKLLEILNDPNSEIQLKDTFKQHHRPSAGFNTLDGAITLTTLFVTHYNFLRPHMELKYKVPVHLHELDGCNTIQEEWLKILSLAA